MSRVQLALNVTDLDASIDFYSKMFGTEPHKIEPGYANFEVAEPPLKLVLFEGVGEPGTLNHLGVEVETPGEVADADNRLNDKGIETVTQDATTCCHAVQDKTWATDPSGQAWEIYTILDDAPQAAACDPVPVGLGGGSEPGPNGSICC